MYGIQPFQLLGKTHVPQTRLANLWLFSLFVETLVKPQKRMVKWKHGVFPPLQTGHTPEPATQNCYQGAVILPLDHGGYTVGCNGVYSPL
jgi:hypothetical protein